MILNNGNSFFDWIDKCFEEKWPKNIISYCFNLYEGEEPYCFHVQIIGSNSYDSEGEWVCEEEKSTGEDVFYFSEKEAGKSWKDGLKYIHSKVKTYLEAGKFSKMLKEKSVVAIGFVDGDLEIVYKNRET